jgi:flavin reductase (DIM6/NTAB) family NADH-FMN oxidoreductase RutF/rhodanese-related sulfurtransferase
MGQKDDGSRTSQARERVVDVTDRNVEGRASDLAKDRQEAGGVELLVAQARSRLRRLEPVEAAAALEGWAVLVDIRPAAERAVEGDIPGALVLERNVLEWRFDPGHPDRLPMAHADLLVIVICSTGTASSLAAAALLDVGVRRATDVVGGFQAWLAAGLPVVGADAGPQPDGESLLAIASGTFPSGVVVVATVDSNNAPVAVAVRSFMALSADPPLVAVALPRTARTLSVLLSSGRFGISVLAADQAQLARRLAVGTSTEDRFDGIGWHAGAGGIPLLDGALGTLECQLDRDTAAGDEVVVLGRVTHADTGPAGREPLVYHRGSLLDVG